MSRLVLGTVQLGMAYGIANPGGQVSLDEAGAILSQARAGGIQMLDTAIAYGDSERRLGEIGVRDWQIVSKLPPIPEATADVGEWVHRSVAASLERLRTPRLHGLLLHRSQDLCGPNAIALDSALRALKAEGKVSKIGVSIYAPEELEPLCSRFDLDLVQSPYNVVDRRIAESGWLSRLRSNGTEVHVRSAFLQGLLLMPPAQRPAYFARWSSLWAVWNAWLVAERLTPLQACLGFVLSQADVDGIVIGVDSSRQLAEILSIDVTGFPLPPAALVSEDPDLVNPSRWNTN